MRAVHSDKAWALIVDQAHLVFHCEEPGSGLAHPRRKFAEVVDRFLDECRHLLETLREVYINDAAAEELSPLDNKQIERGLKRAIMHRKNSMFYKTQEGARVGDLYMSLIHSAELNGANPFDYLVALLRNHAFVEENPEEWMPWNYQETLAEISK